MDKRFDVAIRQAMQCRTPKPRKGARSKTEGGLCRVSLYLTESEREMVRKLAEEFRTSANLIMRSLVRYYRPKTPIDGAE